MRHRIAPGLLAALFVLAQASGAAGARPCPHHDGPGATGEAVAAPEAEREPSHPGGGHPHAAPAAPHAQHAAAADAPGDRHDDAHEGCACLGECSTAPAVVLPEASEIRATVDPPRPPFEGETRPAPAGLVPYLVPFAHAPPLSV